MQFAAGKAAITGALTEPVATLTQGALKAMFIQKLRVVVGAVVAAAMELAAPDDTPATLANRLAFLHGELDDPEVHRIALERSRRRVARYRALIDEAIAAGELAAVDAGRLARSLDAAVSGALLQWVVYREGSLAAWVREEAEGVLAPYRQRGAVGGEVGGRPAAGPRARHKL
jgi:hypothetical protein